MNDSKEAKTGIKDITPVGWERATSQHGKLFQQMLLCKVLRPDRLPEAAEAFVRAVFGEQFLAQTLSVRLLPASL